MPSTNFISLEHAKKLTSTYRGKKEKVLDPQFKGKGVLPVCETFGREAFDTVLAKPGCVGLRIYFAMDDLNFVKLVIVGVNDKNEDMITTTGSTTLMRSTTEESTTEDGDVIIEDGIRCPTICPPPSELNT